MVTIHIIVVFLNHFFFGNGWVAHVSLTSIGHSGYNLQLLKIPEIKYKRATGNYVVVRGAASS